MMVEHNQSANVPSGVGYDNKWKFNGKELDDATGMYYYGARYYDPKISIFVSVDPLAEKFVAWTPYHYVHNNPINLIDPTGMSAEGADGGGWLSKAWNSSKNEVKSWFGGRKSNYEVIVEEPQLIGWDYGESIPCVECHHTTTGSNTKADSINRYPKDIIEVKEGVALWGMASDSGLTTEHKRTSILFSLGMEDVFMRSSAGGTGSKWTYEFLSGMASREDDFKNGGWFI